MNAAVKPSFLQENVTIVVHSCDSYADLWEPFFTLLHRYWKDVPCRILLNTETKDYAFPGLNIECVHPASPDVPYGQRLMEAVQKVKTKYVLPLLDDFFLRQPVDTVQIGNILAWMEADSDIVYFDCDCIASLRPEWEADRYPGYRRLPKGNAYILNMQAAIWRTERYLHYWRPDVTPWEWELNCNYGIPLFSRDKFYAAVEPGKGFLDYGFNLDGMGVFRGKWVMEDVVPLFQKEGITVDFSLRGAYEKQQAKKIVKGKIGLKESIRDTVRCTSRWHILGCILVYLRFRGELDYFYVLEKRIRQLYGIRRKIIGK